MLVGGTTYMRATKTISKSSEYHIPISNNTEVRLSLEPGADMSSFTLCYQPSFETEFSASGRD